MKGIFIGFVLFCSCISYAKGIEGANTSASATNIPYLKDVHDPLFKKIISIYQNDAGQTWVSHMEPLIDEEATLLQWQGKQTVTLRGKKNIIQYLTQEVRHYPNLKKNVGRLMLGGGGVGGNNEPYQDALIVFYEARTTPNKAKPWVWAGCDIFTIREGKIIDWRIEEDTTMKLIQHPSSIDIQHEYQIIDSYWKPTTTTNNLVGMAYLIDLKRTVMPTEKRGELLLARMKNNIEQSTWEPKGILFLKDKQAIKSLFFDGLLQALPDFYENVERTIVAGNALIMLQNPSGTSGTNHRAWYNCDIYFFDGPFISALLFQRDTQMDIAEEQKGMSS